MKLNPDCIRDILLFAEDMITPSQKLLYSPTKTYEHLSKYTTDEIIYHIKQCKLSGLIACTFHIRDECLISDLTPKGHEFLANIREDNLWTKTKVIAGELGTFSLKALFEISANIVVSLINSKFKL